MKRPPVVISLGGSIVAPDQVDVRYLKKFTAFARSLARTQRVVIVVGGGSTSRRYTRAAAKVKRIPSDDLDRIGIAATKLNAELLRALLHPIAHREVIADPRSRVSARARIIIGSGWMPRSSSDGATVHWAVNVGATYVVNLSNVRYVYTADPKVNRNAKPIRDLTWSAFHRMFSGPWKPGAHAPFDPVAARLAARHQLHVGIIHGSDLTSVRTCIAGKPFRGTHLHP